MPLRIFNTLARELQVFEPLTPGEVRMYVCGMTDVTQVVHRHAAHIHANMVAVQRLEGL